MSSTLISHVDTHKVTREQLAMVPTPMATATFKPIPHIELVEKLTSVLQAVNISIDREQFALRHDGLRLFATFDLSLNGIPGSAAALGLRTGNDRYMKLQMIAGARIFVCDNLAFTGDFVALKRMHTSGLDLDIELVEAVELYLKHYGTLVGNVKQLTEKTISDTEAKAIIFDLVYRFKAIPMRLAGDVAKEYFAPRHAEFEPRTMWSLHNATTEVIKQITGKRGNSALPLQLEASQAVGKVFGLLGN
jgi:hypothetical protein